MRNLLIVLAILCFVGSVAAPVQAQSCSTDDALVTLNCMVLRVFLSSDNVAADFDDEESPTIGSTQRCTEGQVQIDQTPDESRCEERSVTDVMPTNGDTLIFNSGTDCTNFQAIPLTYEGPHFPPTQGVDWNQVANPPRSPYKYVARLLDLDGSVVQRVPAAFDASLATFNLPYESRRYHWDVLLVVDPTPEDEADEIAICRSLGGEFFVEAPDQDSNNTGANTVARGDLCDDLVFLRPTDATGYGIQTFEWAWGNGRPARVTGYELRLFTTRDYTATPNDPFYVVNVDTERVIIDLNAVISSSFPATLVSYLFWDLVVFHDDTQLCREPSTERFIPVDVTNAPLTGFGGDGGGGGEDVTGTGDDGGDDAYEAPDGGDDDAYEAPDGYEDYEVGDEFEDYEVGDDVYCPPGEC